jgi:hypothetical protein
VHAKNLLEVEEIEESSGRIRLPNPSRRSTRSLCIK